MNNSKLNLNRFSKFIRLVAKFLNKDFKRSSKFARYVQKELDNQTILYESSCGQSIDGNSYALFTYLLNNPKYNKQE